MVNVYYILSPESQGEEKEAGEENTHSQKQEKRDGAALLK